MKDLHEYIIDPSLLKDLKLSQLQDLVELMPYNQNIRRLIAQFVKSSDKEISNDVEMGAVYSTNRRAYYQLLDGSFGRKKLKKKKKGKSLKLKDRRQEEAKDKEVEYPKADKVGLVSSEIFDEAKMNVVIEEVALTVPVEKHSSDEDALEATEEVSLPESIDTETDGSNQKRIENNELSNDPIEAIGTGVADEQLTYELSDFSKWLIGRSDIVDTIGSLTEPEEDIEEHASETLAKLLEKQGHIDQAINMYQKLALNNPEKSDYFAAQIEKLKSI